MAMNLTKISFSAARPPRRRCPRARSARHPALCARGGGGNMQRAVGDAAQLGAATPRGTSVASAPCAR